MMKIAWISENGFRGKVPRQFNNMRTEFAWFCASGGDHYPISDLPNIYENSYDVAIIILPKNENILNQISTYNGFDLISNMKRIAKKIGWMQEGSVTYYQDYNVSIQVWWYSVLDKMNFLMVHNERDKKYLGGLFDNKKIFVNRSLIIEDAINKVSVENAFSERNNVIIGGNFVSWYGGFDSYIVSTYFGKEIFAPSMGRKKTDESKLEGITHLKYMNWTDWISTLAKYKYSVHLMPTFAAGTFALNTSYLKIPCIGYRGLDTQEILHPDLSVNLYDIESAKSLAIKLKDDEFYEKCSEKTKILYDEHYSEDVWRHRFFKFLEHV